MTEEEIREPIVAVEKPEPVVRFRLPRGSAMVAVMARTMGELLSLRRVLFLLVVGIIPIWFMAYVVWRPGFSAGTMALPMQTGFLVGNFLVVSFLWLVGFYLAYLVIGTSGLELIDRERQRGTLLLIVSKPITRLQFLIGKFLALVITSFLLVTVVLLASVLVFVGTLGIDPDTVSALVGLVPWMLLFSILATALFASVSVAFSTFISSNLVRTVAFLAALVIVFAGGIVVRFGWPGVYEQYRLYYVDGGFNLGNAYVLLLEKAETGRMTPQSQAWLGLTTGAYRAGAQEVLMTMFLGAGGALDPDIGAMPPSLEKSGYLSPVVSVGLCLALTAGAFAAAATSLNRKEVF
jgi:ABC-type transport system involved in multi-copper enzyme maturation permease subunit